MNEQHYLIDNNVLIKMTEAQRSSTFVRDRCRVPSEVLYEARAIPGIQALAPLEYPVSACQLELVRRVMQTVPPGDHKLVDLYSNKGNADPILVAAALEGIDIAATTLFEEDWCIVTDDNGLASKAAELGVRTVGTAAFLRLVSEH